MEPQSLEDARPVRLNSVDIAKGLAIILMVCAHTAGGGMHRQWWDASPHVTSAIDFANALIYSFHMPVFFFVGGLFIERSLARRGPAAFTLEKIKSILYPYLFWGLILGLSNPLTAAFRSKSQPFNWRTLAWDLCSGNASWFLITLFICLIFASLVIKLPNWARMALALAACYLVPGSDVTVLYQPFLFFPFMVAGMWIGGTRMSRLENLPRRAAWTAFAALLIAQFAVIWLTGETTRWDKIPIGLIGIAMLLFLSGALTGTSCGSIFAWYGEGSLAVFLLSPYVLGISRELISRLFHTTAPLPQLAIPAMLASTTPALIWHTQAKLHIGWMFHWPKRHSATKSQRQRVVAAPRMEAASNRLP